MKIELRWQPLSQHAARLIDVPVRDLIAGDAARSHDFALRVGPLYANFARQRFDRRALIALFDLADAARVPEALRSLVEG